MNYLFNKWDNFKAKLKGRDLFIFLDFDGTLTPIAQTPKKAGLSGSARELLRRVSSKSELKLAFISGRSLKDIKKRIGLKNVIYSGNHGLEIDGPKLKFRAGISPGYRTVIENIKDDLIKKMSAIKGVFVEDKGLSLGLHYRLVDKKEVSSVKTLFHEATFLYLARNKIKVESGKKVLEVRPAVEWDKGKVVLWLLRRQILSSKAKNILPIYIGDDLTDEDAFKALEDKGLTIFVGKPKGSRAQYYLKSPAQVIELLERIAAI
jgi:trehalose-phosphatase